MFLYLLIVPVLVINLWVVNRLYKLSKHDKALFQFCDLRRSLMHTVRARGFEMSPEEYLAFRKLITQTSGVIHEYHEFKAMVFSVKVGFFFRTLFAHIDAAKKFESSVAREAGISNEVRKAQQAYLKAVADAVLTFIPARIIIWILTVLIRLIGLIAIKRINQEVDRWKRWLDLLSWAEMKSEDLQLI